MSWRWPSDASEEMKRLESALREHAGHLEVLIAASEIKNQDAEIGKQWRENSSLEKWFPFTADEVANLRSLVTEVYLVASGEKQVAHDDTAALAWIAERCKAISGPA